MTTRVLGVAVFAFLFVGILGLITSFAFAYFHQVTGAAEMQSVAVGFGVLGMIVPVAVLLVIPACFVIVFLTFRSRRR